jgi:hypothetical protein
VLKQIFAILTVAIVAQAEPSKTFKKDDILLFPSTATSGRMFRMERPVERVGIVQSVSTDTLTVQEINYPSRQGDVVYVQTPAGDVRYFGTHDVSISSEDLVPMVESIISKEGNVITRGSRLPILRGRTRTSGYVVYVFANLKNSYAAITDEKGWTCYQNFGEDCHTQEYMKIKVKQFAPAQ